jgi:hypothetical protein
MAAELQEQLHYVRNKWSINANNTVYMVDLANAKLTRMGTLLSITKYSKAYRVSHRAQPSPAFHLLVSRPYEDDADVDNDERPTASLVVGETQFCDMRNKNKFPDSEWGSVRWLYNKELTNLYKDAVKAKKLGKAGTWLRNWMKMGDDQKESQDVDRDLTSEVQEENDDFQEINETNVGEFEEALTQFDPDGVLGADAFNLSGGGASASSGSHAVLPPPATTVAKLPRPGQCVVV